MEHRTCTETDCGKPSRSPGSALCKMHYHRQYRHGSTRKVATAADVTASHGRRYRTRYLPGHPLAMRDGKVYLHRAVLYDKIGSGPHTCHWCGTAVEWAHRGHPACLHVDHLNDIGDDNRPENLVPSCHRCNSTRAQQHRHAVLVEAGWWSVNDTIKHRQPLVMANS